jgi:phage terminase small subunit
MMIADDVPQPPAHLSPTAAQWWRTVVERYELEQHHLRLLQLAAEAWDRSQQARALIEAEGLILIGRQGARPHPAIAIERDSRLGFARLLRELDLDTEPPRAERIAPPALFSNNRGHRRARQGSDA